MLPTETILALALFAVATSITPGPNNLMLTASGVNFGFRRTIPHMFGIGLGFVSLLLAVGAGLGTVLAASPGASFALKVVGAGYMLVLAWRIARARPPERGTARGDGRPMSLGAAALFQWVNPKAWVMALSAMAIYVRPTHPIADVVFVAAVFGLVNVPVVGIWAGFGHLLRDWLQDPARVRVFNIAMAVLLVASIVPMVV